MKSGHILFLAAILSVLVYVPVANSFTLMYYIKKFKHLDDLIEKGVEVGNSTSKYTVELKDFLEFEKDEGERLTASLWHERDSLFVEVVGRDMQPQKRKMLMQSALDTVHDVSSDDRMRISVDLDLDRVKHVNYNYSFAGFAAMADNMAGRFVPGSRKPCPHPFLFRINGADWTFTAAVPLEGSRTIGFNMARRYYGKHDLSWTGTNDAKRFVKLNLR